VKEEYYLKRSWSQKAIRTTNWSVEQTLFSYYWIIDLVWSTCNIQIMMEPSKGTSGSSGWCWFFSNKDA